MAKSINSHAAPLLKGLTKYTIRALGDLLVPVSPLDYIKMLTT